MARQKRVLRLVEDAFHFIESRRDVSPEAARTALDLVSDYIGSVYQTGEESPEEIRVRDLLEDVCARQRPAGLQLPATL